MVVKKKKKLIGKRACNTSRILFERIICPQVLADIAYTAYGFIRHGKESHL